MTQAGKRGTAEWGEVWVFRRPRAEEMGPFWRKCQVSEWPLALTGFLGAGTAVVTFCSTTLGWGLGMSGPEPRRRPRLPPPTPLGGPQPPRQASLTLDRSQHLPASPTPDPASFSSLPQILLSGGSLIDVLHANLHLSICSNSVHFKVSPNFNL